jgi:hypothetical protein
VAEEIQKHQLLVKLLKMTTSANDGEALTAMRKANDLLTAAGWDWDRLMAGKITVVGDPFANLGNPAPKVERWTSEPRQAPLQSTPRRKPMPINSQLSNKFEGHCYCCGRLVAVGGGFLFKAEDYHSRAPSGWKVVCTTDNTNHNAIIGPTPALRQGRGARKVTADDLA